VIDQHFAQRGRLGRLLSTNTTASSLGFGIDENTSVVVNGKSEFEEGAITVIDVADITHNNLDDLLKDEANLRSQASYSSTDIDLT